MLLSEIEIFYKILSPRAFLSFHLNRGDDKIKRVAKFKDWNGFNMICNAFYSTEQ